MPQISVIVPAYNVAEYISDTLDSALAQTFKDLEIIVVNDGSPDTEILEKTLSNYFDEIVYLKKPNGGVATARNVAIAEARGSIVAFLDGDDIWLPNKLSSQIQFMEDRDFHMVYCDAALFGEPLYESKTFMSTAPSVGEVKTESLLNGSCNVLTSATIVKKDDVIRNGLFDENAHRIEDFDLWFRLCKNGVKIGYQTEVMLKYRIRAGSLTGNSIERSQRSIAAFELVRDKNVFTESELAAWKRQYDASKAELCLEKAKRDLVNENFAEARRNLTEANYLSKNLKLKVLNILLAISPKLVLAVFRKLRPTEFSYIAPNKGQK